MLAKGVQKNCSPINKDAFDRQSPTFHSLLRIHAASGMGRAVSRVLPNVNASQLHVWPALPLTLCADLVWEHAPCLPIASLVAKPRSGGDDLPGRPPEPFRQAIGPAVSGHFWPDFTGTNQVERRSRKPEAFIVRNRFPRCAAIRRGFGARWSPPRRPGSCGAPPLRPCAPLRLTPHRRR